MYNRFGFSSKKKDNHRPTFPSNRISSIGKISNHNVESTPFGGKPNQQFSFGKDASSMGKLSSGKPFSFASNAAIPSTAKSVRRTNLGLGLNSDRKSSINSAQSKLFGVTPQHSRSSYMSQNRPSTSRLSRSSRGGKDQRPLSDQAFHRECQENIYNFLTLFEYSPPLTKQALLRPSLSDVSRIFEFLFNYFQPGIVIKNGPTTAIEVVVPKMLTELGYPHQLKRSDLVSFSGGRQLGAILESIWFVAGVISYSENADVSQFNKQLDSEQFIDTDAQISEIALSAEQEPSNGIVDEQLKALASELFGTPEQIGQLESEQIKLEQNLNKLETDITKLVELPNKIQTLSERNDDLDKRLADMIEKDTGCNRILQELSNEYLNKQAELEIILNNENRLNKHVESQKDIIMPYRLSVKRKNQIDEEMSKANQQIKDLDELMLTNILEVSKQRAQNGSFINDLEDVIVSFFNSINTSRTNQISPDFSKAFEEDKEWKAIYTQLKLYKNWDIDIATDDLVREVKSFGQRFQGKFKDFKHKLLQQLSSLEGSASIEVICKKRELQATLVKKRQHCTESEAELKGFVAENENLEKQETKQLSVFRGEIDLASKKIIEIEKEKDAFEKDIQSQEYAILKLKDTINDKRKHFMKSISESFKQDQKLTKTMNKGQEKLSQHAKNIVDQKKEKLQIFSNYRSNLVNSV